MIYTNIPIKHLIVMMLRNNSQKSAKQYVFPFWGQDSFSTVEQPPRRLLAQLSLLHTFYLPSSAVSLQAIHTRTTVLAKNFLHRIRG